MLAALATFAVFAGFCWLALLLRSLLAGARFGRSLWVAAVLALLVSLPLLPGCILVAAGPEPAAGFPERLVDSFMVGMPAGPVAWLVLVSFAAAMLHLPRRLRDLCVPLDAQHPLRTRVAELARAVGAPVPEVTTLRAAGAALFTNAFAGGLVRPTVVLGDGVLVGLDGAQRDAIVAHELAHVARHHVIQRLLAMALATTVVAAFAGELRFALLVPLLVVAIDLALVLVAPGQELVCDADAARVAGARATTAALDKIHAHNQLLDPFPGDAWFHATVTHPANSVRAAAIAARAPGEVDLAPDMAAHARRCRRVRVVALALYVGAFAAAVLVEGPEWLRAALLAVATLPIVLRIVVLFRLRGEERWHRRLAPVEARREWLLRVLLFVAGFAMLVATSFTGAPWVLFGGFALLLASVLWRRGRVRARRRRAVLLQRGDLRALLEHCRAAKPRWRTPALREAEALARAGLGEVEAAAADLVELHAEHPRHLRALLHAASMLRVRDPDRAQELVQQVLAERPQNQLAHALAAAVALQRGDLDAATAHVDGVLRALPRVGRWHALAARIARRRGDDAAAGRHFATADRLAPNDPATWLARAERDVDLGAASAAASVARLRELLDALPLAFLRDDLALLEARLATAADGGGAKAPSHLH